MIVADFLLSWRALNFSFSKHYRSLCLLSSNIFSEKQAKSKDLDFVGRQLLCVLDVELSWTRISRHDKNTGITSKPTTVKNPQANAIVERLHKTMVNVLRVMLYVNPSENDRSDGIQQRHDGQRSAHLQSNSDWRTETTTSR